MSVSGVKIVTRARTLQQIMTVACSPDRIRNTWHGHAVHHDGRTDTFYLVLAQ